MLQKSQFYGCAMSSILVIDSYSGNKKRLLDGYCANQLHIFKPASTWRDAYYQCKIRDF